MKLAFVAIAAVAALSAFSTNYFAQFHYALRNGQLELISDFDPANCDPQTGSQCTYILETSSQTAPEVITEQSPEWNSVRNNPDANGIDKVYVD